MLLFVLTCKRKLSCLWKKIVIYRYGLGNSLSVLFLILNILIYNYGCQGLRNHINPVQLTHGYAPVFPHHYFHKPFLLNGSYDLDKSFFKKETDKLDNYFHSYIIQDILTTDFAPVAHVIWCDVGPFTFAHYLTILSTFKVISPSILNLHVIKEPDLDPDGYFQFLPDLERDLPPLVKKILRLQDACFGSKEEKIIAYMNILGATGGFAINGRTVISPSPALKRILSYEINIATQADGNSDLLFIGAHANILENMPTKESLTTFLQSHATKYYKCESVRVFSVVSQHLCSFVHEDIFPVFIFNGTSDFDHLARWIAYGSSKKLISQPADRIIVPNIVHYVWLGQRELDFFSYLSLLSSLHVLKADSVYIHGDYKPLGEHWELARRDPRVKFINRDFPVSVYGEPIKLYKSHASDYLRADVLLRYGGIYADWDVIFLQEIPLSVRLHKTTANVDWPETGAFPDVFNLGVLVSAPGAPFLRHFLESYRWYLDKHWSYNAIHIPYKVYEKQPQSLNVNRHLQILCAQNVCHAPWLHDYKQETADHLNTKKLNWNKDALAIHWTYPDPDEFKSKDSLIKSETITGEIGKFVLKKANIIS